MDRTIKLAIVVAPIVCSPGHFVAKLASNGDVLVASSRIPFLDAARRLLELGHMADTILVMKHGQTESLRATIGTAAALTVKETENGPAFRRYDAPQRLSVAPPIAPSDMTGVFCSLPPRPAARTSPGAARHEQGRNLTSDHGRSLRPSLPIIVTFPALTPSFQRGDTGRPGFAPSRGRVLQAGRL
jgi:hypothetical protein